jgi:hypothetical protein
MGFWKDPINKRNLLSSRLGPKMAAVAILAARRQQHRRHIEPESVVLRFEEDRGAAMPSRVAGFSF